MDDGIRASPERLLLPKGVIQWACRDRPKSPQAQRLAPRQQRGAKGSNFGILGKGKSVFHIDSERAHRIFDLAMTEKDLDGAEVAGRPVDN